jgi:multidrug efflux pump subunit AcrA (membrane-fusion protein)
MKEQRERAIEAMLARAAAETGKPTKSDAVLQHLEKIIAVRKAALNRAQELHETKSAIPKSDVQQTEADLAEAEIRAELRKEDLAKSQATAEAGRLAQQAHELHIEVTMDVSRYKVLGLPPPNRSDCLAVPCRSSAAG